MGGNTPKTLTSTVEMRRNKKTDPSFFLPPLPAVLVYRLEALGKRPRGRSGAPARPKRCRPKSYQRDSSPPGEKRPTGGNVWLTLCLNHYPGMRSLIHEIASHRNFLRPGAHAFLTHGSHIFPGLGVEKPNPTVG